MRIVKISNKDSLNEEPHDKASSNRKTDSSCYSHENTNQKNVSWIIFCFARKQSDSDRAIGTGPF